MARSLISSSIVRRSLLSTVALVAALPVAGHAQADRAGLDTIKAGKFDFGKMWTFEYPPLDYLADTYDFHPDTEWFERARLSALRIPGCSASFVSAEGLIVTNHHCVTGELQHNSTPEKNLLVDGYVAKTRADELPGGPRSRVYVTTGFTDVTDRLESEELTNLLNQYLTEMARIAQEYGANFDKFIGDAIVLYFGDPETKGVKEDASDCVRMAIAMQRRMKELQSEWRDAGLEKPFEIRIGINTGYCTVGNFGNEDRMDYTIIGGEVNLTARLEYEAEVGGILLANATYQLVKDWVMAEEAEVIEVKGFPRPITTYAVKGIYDELEKDGQVIRHDQDGLNLTIEHDKLGLEGRARAVEALEKALRHLKEL